MIFKSNFWLKWCLACSLIANVYLYQEYQTSKQLSSQLQTPDKPSQINLNKLVIPAARTNSELQLADQYFMQQEFDLAVNAYADLLQTDEADAQQLLTNWQRSVNLWINSGQLQLAQAFITAFLQYQPYNLVILESEALRLTALGDIRGAIETYFTLIENSLDVPQQQGWLNQINTLANEYTKQLKQRALWLEVESFLEFMLYFRPSAPDYQYEMAQTQLKMNNLDKAKFYLEPLLTVENYQLKASNMFNAIELKELGKVIIPLTKAGEHFLVTGQFDSENKIDLLIDTGASISVITKSAFNRLSLWYRPKHIRNADINTAGGTIRAPIYQFNKFSIDNMVVDNIEFVVIDNMTMDKSNGLLGMNYLKNFDFQIDQAKHELQLGYRNGLDK